MKVAIYKGRRFYFNEFWMEIYEEKKCEDGSVKLIRKKNFHKWESILAPYWKKEFNILACKSINTRK